MSVRKMLAGGLTGALATTAFWATAPAAHAVEPDDTTFTATGNDLIGAGSDTTQHAMFLLANAWNAQTPAPAYKVATYAATGGGEIPLPSGAIGRPNGSGAGKALLYGSGNNPDIDYARSSSALNSTEVGANLFAIPFALDTLAMAVASSATNAPATLTPAQIVSIYKGDVTNWSQVGGTNGTIVPMIPQGGSGTRSFFNSQLTAMNGGTAVTLAASVVEVQEHDDTAIKGNPNAIAPFSVGRAGLLGGTVEVVDGWDAERAVYNVVRESGLSDPKIDAVFGPEGFVCSDEAFDLVEAAGFDQLDSEADGGECGVAATEATSNFKLNIPVLSDDSAFEATTDDLIGAGSDTTQHAMFLLSEGWNAQTPAPAYKVATFAATGGGEIPLPSGAIGRPNGSGAGKALLYGSGNNPDIDYARSSSALNSTEVGANLFAIPFALDTLAMAVASSATNAPATLTPAQIVSIYKGDVTNWSQVGGTNGTIVPMIPQGGSGTRSFFNSQLTAMNGGTAVTLAASVVEVQEHDDTAIKGNPNAIAPFSVGRAGLLGGTVEVVDGWDAERAVYNVVRESGLSDPKFDAVFGEEGYICSEDAKELIEGAGFLQLASTTDGGVCGEATQDPTSNFTVNDLVETVATTTTLAATSSAPRRATLTATVDGGESTPAGTVTFTEGETVVAENVPVQGGVATSTLTGVAPGEHTYTAEFVPTDAEAFEPSTSTEASVTVKTKATITEGFAAKTKKASVKGKITVKLAGTSTKATGKVTVKLGKKTVGKGTLKNGVATVTVNGLKNGKNKLTATWAGDDLADKATKSFTVTKQKPKKKNKE